MQLSNGQSAIQKAESILPRATTYCCHSSWSGVWYEDLERLWVVIVDVVVHSMSPHRRACVPARATDSLHVRRSTHHVMTLCRAPKILVGVEKEPKFDQAA